MQIILNNDEVLLAIEEYVESRSNPGYPAQLEIDLKAGRGDNGFSATVSIFEVEYDVDPETGDISNVRRIAEPVEEKPKKTPKAKTPSANATNEDGAPKRRGRPKKVDQAPVTDSVTDNVTEAATNELSADPVAEPLPEVAQTETVSETSEAVEVPEIFNAEEIISEDHEIAENHVAEAVQEDSAIQRDKIQKTGSENPEVVPDAAPRTSLFANLKKPNNQV